MLITNLLPLLHCYALGFDLIAAEDDTVTLTIMPRKLDNKSPALEPGETRPISITASAAEIDAELEKGAEGALGQLIASRRTLAEQIAEQREAAEAARTAAAARAKARSATPAPKTTTSSPAAKVEAPTSPPADANPAIPASLF